MNDLIQGQHIKTGDAQTYDPCAHHLMEVMDGSGDTKSIWDPTNKDEVEAAKAQYDSLTKKGYRAFQVTGKGGEKGEQMDEWDPKAGRMIMVPPMAGG